MTLHKLVSGDKSGVHDAQFYSVLCMDPLSNFTVLMYLKSAADSMLSSLIRWIRFDDSELGAPNLPGCVPCSELGRPMMLLNVLTEYCNGEAELRDKYREHFEWAVSTIFKHVRMYQYV